MPEDYSLESVTDNPIHNINLWELEVVYFNETFANTYTETVEANNKMALEKIVASEAYWVETNDKLVNQYLTLALLETKSSDQEEIKHMPKASIVQVPDIRLILLQKDNMDPAKKIEDTDIRSRLMKIKIWYDIR